MSFTQPSPTKKFPRLLSIGALLILTSSSPLLAGTATIEIDAAKPGPKINPQMYGIFLEEINHGVDGGLYAELIRNRGFEDEKPPEGFVLRNGRWMNATDGRAWDTMFSRYGYFTNGAPFWKLLQDSGAEVSMRIDLEHPLNPATPRSLRLDISNPGTGRVGIANEGYWGISTVAGHDYELSFWARCADGFNGAVSATLENTDGAPFSALARIEGIGAEWKQFKARLTASKTDPKSKFVLSANSKGTVWFDMVSLFPARTFKDRPNGLRPDLAQMIADLKPGFVRFPGGCVVEGGTIETAYNWKKTVGPLEQREEVWGAWAYRFTHGMGFYEYLQFCEDVGAAPLYVGFAGETCMFRGRAVDVPMAEMGWVTENFSDALEYANGSATTPWGKRRAEQGHPGSFNLKLVEIGNENGTREFPQRYKLVHTALKEKYPDVKYIADLSFNAQMMRRETSFDIEDNHFYNSPQWFMNNTHLYDDRDRKLPPVYDGEVAVTSAEGGRDRGNVLAALGEGAFLLGLERNADVVHMVSYAPLMGHVNGRSGTTPQERWHGMIYFDSARAYGTASYYLWKMFGVNRPDYSLQTEVKLVTDKPAGITGAVGLGTWLTSSEYKDIQVEKNGQILYRSDFSKGADDWKRDGGNWSVTDGAYRQANNATGLSYIGDENWSDYTLTLKARKLAGPEGFLIVFGHKGQDKYWWNIGGWGNSQHALEFNQNPVGAPKARVSLESNRWYDIKVQLEGRRIRCYLDGELIHEVNATDPERFFALAGRDQASGDFTLKVINGSAESTKAHLNLANIAHLSSEAEITVLKSDSPQDNNSLDRPTLVQPVTRKLAIPGPAFDHEFPAYSFTLIRAKTK